MPLHAAAKKGRNQITAIRAVLAGQGREPGMEGRRGGACREEQEGRSRKKEKVGRSSKEEDDSRIAGIEYD